MAAPDHQDLPGSPAERVELVWPGKAASARRESATAPPRLQSLSHHGTGGDETRWRNQLILGDNLEVALPLLDDYGGQFDLIYVDPPFGTGSERRSPQPGNPAAFDDRWAGDGVTYLDFLYARLPYLRDLLAPSGTLFLHCDPRMDWALRCLLNEVFGSRQLINQIIWHYTGGGRSRRRFSCKHDLIFWVARGETWTFNIDAMRQPYQPSSHYARAGIRARSGKHYLPHPAGTPVDDVWDIPILNPMARERLGYPTQKPERLLERVILAASKPGDLVGDLFCGSGTTLAVAERLGRRWLGCDVSPEAIDLSRRRLLAIPNHRSFEVLRCIEPMGGIVEDPVADLGGGT